MYDITRWLLLSEAFQKKTGFIGIYAVATLAKFNTTTGIFQKSFS